MVGAGAQTTRDGPETVLSREAGAGDAGTRDGPGATGTVISHKPDTGATETRDDSRATILFILT
jgi:hypothetical protein